MVDKQKPEPDVSAQEKEFVKKWLKDIEDARKFHDKPFERMRWCRRFARHGCDKTWADGSDDENYVVPLVTRHINLSVAQLYARNPKIAAKRSPKMLFRIWDGKADTITQAMAAAQMGDLSVAPLLAELEQARNYETMMDRFARTLELAANYYINEQDIDFKAMMKQVVRRTKVTGVGWVKLNFQREVERSPEVDAQLRDTTEQIASVQSQIDMLDGVGSEEQKQRVEELRASMEVLQSQGEIITREGPVFDMPASDAIIVDPDCTHLKTLAGARWVAHHFSFTPRQINDRFKVDVTGHFTAQQSKREEGQDSRSGQQNEGEHSRANVYEVYDKANGYHFVVCEGYPGYIKAPAAPPVSVDRFWPFFPLVFNEVDDSDESIYPPSDVWAMRHPQREYNRAREGLREHRIANKPAYVAAKGRFERDDKDRLESHDTNAIIEIKLNPNEKVEDALQRKPTVPIDPNLYEVGPIYDDILRSTGAQEANFGATSGSTATESAIADESRSAGIADNVDDLDDMLTTLARAMGQLMLREVSRETIEEIVGPGAVWPDLSREEVVQEVSLEVGAGSSGRPNQAAELAKLERAAPFVFQLPNINPEVVAKKYLPLLDIDVEEAIVSGMPSIQAINAMAGAAGQATGDPRTDPAAQGGEGAANAPAPAATEGGGQPAFPAAGEGTIVA